MLRPQVGRIVSNPRELSKCLIPVTLDAASHPIEAVISGRAPLGVCAWTTEHSRGVTSWAFGAQSKFNSIVDKGGNGLGTESQSFESLRAKAKPTMAPTVCDLPSSGGSAVWRFLGHDTGVTCVIEDMGGFWAIEIHPGGFVAEVRSGDDMVARFLQAFDRFPLRSVESRVGPFRVGSWIVFGEGEALVYDGPTKLDRIIESLPGYKKSVTLIANNDTSSGQEP